MNTFDISYVFSTVVLIQEATTDGLCACGVDVCLSVCESVKGERRQSGRSCCLGRFPGMFVLRIKFRVKNHLWGIYCAPRDSVEHVHLYYLLGPYVTHSSGKIMLPILQMRKLRLTELNGLHSMLTSILTPLLC